MSRNSRLLVTIFCVILAAVSLKKISWHRPKWLPRSFSLHWTAMPMAHAQTGDQPQAVPAPPPAGNPGDGASGGAQSLPIAPPDPARSDNPVSGQSPPPPQANDPTALPSVDTPNPQEAAAPPPPSVQPPVPPPAPTVSQPVPEQQNNANSVPLPTLIRPSQMRGNEADSAAHLPDQDFIYDPTGLRDPFRSAFAGGGQGPIVQATGENAGALPFLVNGKRSEGGLDSFELESLRLVGILWEVGDPKAMVQSPKGKVFMVHKQTRIGRNNGYVAAVREGEIVVIEVSNDGKTPTTRVLSLQK